MKPHNLFLRNFRCYEEASLTFSSPLIFVSGPNSCGKTTILEALSLLSPGRGLRKAHKSLLQHRAPTMLHSKDDGQSCSAAADPMAPWLIRATFHTPHGPLLVETSGENDAARHVSVNHSKLASQMELSQWLSVQWVTPTMDRLWTEGWSCRREYFDRWVFTLDPSYGPLLLQYEKLLRERQNLLQAGGNPGWISSVERVLAEHILALSTKRQHAVENLHHAFRQYPTTFPMAHFRLKGTVEQILHKAGHREEALHRLEEGLRQGRPVDLHRKTTNLGTHRTQVEIGYKTAGSEEMVEAAFCSTGQQRKLLLSISLGIARLCHTQNPGRFSLFLLDDVVSYLDHEGRELLLAELATLGGLVWMTSAEATLFPPHPGSQHITFLHPQTRFYS